MHIIPIKYGESVLPENMIFINGNKNKFRKISFKIFAVKTKNKFILIDAGCETMPGFKMKNFIGTVNALKAQNINIEDITDVVITHSHHDHIECIKYFKNAQIYIQKDEYDAGKEYISVNNKINIFDYKFSVCENINIIKIGGHSKGSSIVEIRDNDKIYVISGDECYLRECLERKIPTGCSYDNEKSKNFVEKYADKKYMVLLCHDE